jgi:hydroxymethylpyrimidine/phosphomethylpyrimidine kinase
MVMLDNEPRLQTLTRRQRFGQTIFLASEKTPNLIATACTMAAATTCFIAHGCPVQAAVEQAQAYVEQAVKASRQFGFGKPSQIDSSGHSSNQIRSKTMPSHHWTSENSLSAVHSGPLNDK